ncbi:hypothetical protein HYW20_04315 [Candidatus Woesearchaeota archaeon]|nr:hypothetical protein [Candidatus Woesearchaeota archaeon]
MKIKTILLAVLLISVFLVGCRSSQTGYASYNQQQGQQQGQYVGGGCGVTPSGDYADTPVEGFDSSGSATL